mmetsp:Transcript_38142/g.61953  ORF Transcript_38142/g.61953 Transcript_38142/m.61953 type:complete len:307 (-) Transcript_38142:90-1010(-)
MTFWSWANEEDDDDNEHTNADITAAQQQHRYPVPQCRLCMASERFFDPKTVISVGKYIYLSVGKEAVVGTAINEKRMMAKNKNDNSDHTCTTDHATMLYLTPIDHVTSSAQLHSKAVREMDLYEKRLRMFLRSRNASGVSVERAMESDSRSPRSSKIPEHLSRKVMVFSETRLATIRKVLENGLHRESRRQFNNQQQTTLLPEGVNLNDAIMDSRNSEYFFVDFPETEDAPRHRLLTLRDKGQAVLRSNLLLDILNEFKLPLPSITNLLLHYRRNCPSEPEEELVKGLREGFQKFDPMFFNDDDDI